jgi:hypothetical protein
MIKELAYGDLDLAGIRAVRRCCDKRSVLANVVLREISRHVREQVDAQAVAREAVSDHLWLNFSRVVCREGRV